MDVSAAQHPTEHGATASISAKAQMQRIGVHAVLRTVAPGQSSRCAPSSLTLQGPRWGKVRPRWIVNELLPDHFFYGIPYYPRAPQSSQEVFLQSCAFFGSKCAVVAVHDASSAYRIAPVTRIALHTPLIILYRLHFTSRAAKLQAMK